MAEKRSVPGTYVKRIRQNKKYYVVGVWNGNLVEKKRWSFKTRFDKQGRVVAINKNDASEYFKQNKSFSMNVKRTMLANVYETVNYDAMVLKGDDRKQWRGKKKVIGAALPRGVIKYQWVCEGFLDVKGHYTQVVARSEQHGKSYPLEKARSEAFERFLAKLAGTPHGGSGNPDAGWSRFEYVTRFHEGPVYYQAI